MTWMPKSRLQALARSALPSELNRIARKYWRRATGYNRRVARLRPDTSPRGRVLLSYILDPLLEPAGARLPHSHTHFWETRTMAESFLERGFAVDGISWTNRSFVPEHSYEFAIDVRLNLERLEPSLGSATRIFHTDTSHWRTSNGCQKARHDRLEARRGVRLNPFKLVEENRAAEVAHHITYLGNEFTRQSFAFANKPMTRIPVSVPTTYDWPDHKDWERARRRFLWLGSGGLVHKGLDLVLEAFTELPDLELVVCGPIGSQGHEPDFEREYRKELFDTPNVHTLGWIDVVSREFVELCGSVGALVYPSCAEGGGSSALTCIHAGLVPLLTRGVSVDLEPHRGVLLEDDSIAALREAIRASAATPPRDLEARARAGWEWARAHHTRDVFRDHYRGFVDRLLAGQSS